MKKWRCNFHNTFTLTMRHYLFFEFWLVDTWFFTHWRHHHAVTRLENVRQSNIRRGKRLGFQLSLKHPLMSLLESTFPNKTTKSSFSCSIKFKVKNFSDIVIKDFIKRFRELLSFSKKAWTEYLFLWLFRMNLWLYFSSLSGVLF